MHILDQTWYTKATFYWAPSKVTWNFPLIRQHTGLPQTPAPSEHTLRDYMKEHERHQGAHWLSLFAPAQAFLPQQAGTQASWWKGIPSAAAGIDRRVCVYVCIGLACWGDCWHPLCHGPRPSHLRPIERAAPSDAGLPLNPAARHDITLGGAPPPLSHHELLKSPPDHVTAHTIFERSSANGS